MLIAQITDPHIGYDLHHPGERNSVRLLQVIEHVLAVEPAPDLVIVTGDLTEHGDVASYRRFRDMIGALPMPVLLAVGNHDTRAALLEVFPETETNGGFIQYARDLGDLRLVVVDTLDEEAHGGAFDEVRAGWLEAELARAPETPTLVAIHHPPVKLGIAWMDPHTDAPWALRLEAVIARHQQVVTVIAGHVHRSAVTRWAGTILAVSASCAPQIGLDLSPIDVDAPDNRALIVEELPSFALHRWEAGALVSYFATAGHAPPLARFDATTQHLIAGLMAPPEEVRLP